VKSQQLPKKKKLPLNDISALPLNDVIVDMNNELGFNTTGGILFSTETKKEGHCIGD
jgi:hypothetical protein